ncbi:MAG: hypothetical protein GWN29_04915 [Gammaproteobacteria bacterium]|nr:hypothetical protein [Gammaproteobacteria bacterium]NIV51095.1 hypothetical protein [Gammaproteobacteria bacterium]NIW23947.1 hypothetical protein [Gammaproteobacteria bacterium]NIX85037.1 hypothetical protein [Gammaproteobacteria bacterium]
MAVSTLALGYNSTIEIDTDSNDGSYGTSATIGGFTSGSLALARTNPDSTNIDTSGYQGREYGIKGATLNFECLDDQNADTFQDQVLADYDAGTKRWFRIRPRIGAGYVQYSAKFVIDSASYTVEQGGVVRFSLAASSDGTITKSDQS